MGIHMQNNGSLGPDDIELSVVVEEDEGIFLAVTAEDADGSVVWDYFTAVPSEVEAFFREVAGAKAEYDRRKQ